jgi:carboxymethylenebutenolidase
MLKRFAAYAAVAGLAVAALARAEGQMVSYPSGSETVQGYLATGSGAAKKPAVVLIHEWWGLNDWAKKKADGFAQQGYVALAPDLYRGKSPPTATRRTSSCAGCRRTARCAT